MSQNDFALSKVVARLISAKLHFHVMLADDAEHEALVSSCLRVRCAREDLRKMQSRTLEISLKTLNLKASATVTVTGCSVSGRGTLGRW